MRSLYSVDRNEIERFVEEKEIVRSYLDKYNRGTNWNSSYGKCAHILCRFFKWLRKLGQPSLPQILNES